MQENFKGVQVWIVVFVLCFCVFNQIETVSTTGNECKWWWPLDRKALTQGEIPITFTQISFVPPTSIAFNGQKQGNTHSFNVSWLKIIQLKEASHLSHLLSKLPKIISHNFCPTKRNEWIAEFQKQSCLQTSSAFDHHICTFVMNHHQRLEIGQDPPFGTGKRAIKTGRNL